MINIQKAAIIGSGFVGATSAYSLMISGIFSEIVLIDINEKKAHGDAMDIAHGLPYNSPMSIYSGNYCDISDAAVIIITAGANQKPNESRIDLVRKNTEIFKTIINNIIKYNTEAILLVVSNPVDILTYVTLKLSGFPSNRVIGSGTVIDTARLKQLIGQRLEVDSRNVHAFIIGEHGDSELAVWSSANISGVDLDKFCSLYGTDTLSDIHRMFYEVRDSAYHIIEAKGATYYAIAESVNRICTAIVRDENSILPVSALTDGHYGLNGICIGIPSVIGQAGIKRVLEIPLSTSEREMLHSSAKILKSVVDSLDISEVYAL